MFPEVDPEVDPEAGEGDASASELAEETAIVRERAGVPTSGRPKARAAERARGAGRRRARGAASARRAEAAADIVRGASLGKAGSAGERRVRAGESARGALATTPEHVIHFTTRRRAS